MRVINVIYVKNGEVEEVTSFGVFEEQLSDDVVEQAEEKFKEYVRSSEPEVSDEDLDMYIEEGCYSGVNYGYSIVWSDI
jgi:hypothetical protein